jgi:hypothetical protein
MAKTDKAFERRIGELEDELSLQDLRREADEACDLVRRADLDFTSSAVYP